MANAQRGEVALTIGDQTFNLVLDFAAMCELEAVLSTREDIVVAGEAMMHALRLSLRHNRALFYATSRRHHRDLTLERCGDLLGELGVEKFLTTVLQLRDSAMPDKEDRSDRPQEARPVNGTGVPISSKPDGSVSAPTSSGA